MSNSNMPASISSSKLFARLQAAPEFLNSIVSIRGIVRRLAETVARTFPSFTDHSIAHMDAMWSVADKVITCDEFSNITDGEAFLLASSFYLHDIGMAYAATADGLDNILKSNEYKSAKLVFESSGICKEKVDNNSLSSAVRKLHANAAIELATGPIPGTDIYIIESTEIRGAWGSHCGKIAASHNWDLDAVENSIGKTGTGPLPGNNKGDLGYVAALLRIIDYAHINRERAPSIERAFRSPIDSDSLSHWLAQENIDGPDRSGNELVYRTSKPISDVDAWWLFYGMLCGLDSEIRSVQRYLDGRVSSQQRFSLQSVRGAGTPHDASKYIEPDGFLPLEINLRTGSIDRLVQLLAGESLYGPDPMAAIRELIQNARDAVKWGGIHSGTR